MTAIRRADPRAQRKALMLVLVSAVTGTLLLSAFEVYRDPILAWLRSQPSEHMTVMLLLVATMLSAPLLALAAHLWVLGANVVRAEMYPPPGLRLIRDTTVITGSAALLRGRGLKGIAVCLGLLSGLLCLIFWRLIWALK